MGRKNKYRSKKINSAGLKKKALGLFMRSPRKRLTAKQVLLKLNVDKNVDAVKHVLNQLVEEGQLYMFEDGRYKLEGKALQNSKLSGPSETLTGVIDMTKKGSAYLMVDADIDDLHIAASRLNGAMDGDTVEVLAFYPKGRRRGEAQVTRIIKRKITSVVGKLYMHKRQGIVDVFNTRSPLAISIKQKHFNGAQDMDTVLVEILDWGNQEDKMIWGAIKEVIPEEDKNEISMQAILSMNGFDSFFPKEVEAEMAAIPDEIPQDDIQNRRDFRDVLTLTIDPDTAKDFDDAISYKVLEDGKLEVGVHIADVTHYVRPKTAIDREAFDRSTSVYLVDRCIPMLPEKLSNNLCSLMPNVDRLAFSAVFTFDENYGIVDRWFGKTVIHSDKRFSYEEAQEKLDTKEGEYAEELNVLNEIAYKLRAKRFKEGSVNFDTEEVKFILDETGKPIDLFVKVRKDAHMLIEDFMLLANKEVALFIERRQQNSSEVPFVYRIHDEPNIDKLYELSLFAHEMGFQFSVDTPAQIRDSINRLAEASKEDSALKLLEPLAIRTMSKAIYSTNNIGHFGLGFSHYAHFTSPIRRYADVLVHRILFANLIETKRYNKEKLETRCKHISAQERKAVDAERDSIKYKQVEYMMGKIGQNFDAVVSGIIERGLFVELPDSKAEGLIPFDTLDEMYELRNGNLVAVAKRTGDKLRLGDNVRVRLIAADLENRQLDFKMLDSEEE